MQTSAGCLGPPAPRGPRQVPPDPGPLRETRTPLCTHGRDARSMRWTLFAVHFAAAALKDCRHRGRRRCQRIPSPSLHASNDSRLLRNRRSRNGPHSQKR
ncbi:hypothetical protein MRX96_047444 [Rhipicephalus microplus]